MPEYPVPAGVAEQFRTLHVPGIEIPAALTIPTARAPIAALLLIPGSLFSDVNGDFPSWNAYPGASVSLAHQLAERGIAVYRWAKTGPGTGAVITDADEAAKIRTWDGRVLVAQRALEDMQRALTALDIACPIIIGGHSEGAVVAERIVAAGAEARALVLFSGPAIGILSVMREQMARSAPEEMRSMILEALEVAISAIRVGAPIPAHVRQVYGVSGLASMDPAQLVYLRQCEATDPCAVLATLPLPTLVVQGDDDSSVTMEHARRLVAAHTSGGKKRVTDLLELPGLNHFYKMVPAGTDMQANFGWPGPCDLRVADGVAAWITRVAARSP